MQHLNNSIRFSASDLVVHLDSHHFTALDAAVARGSLTKTKPRIWDPVLQTLVERGLVHEHEYVEMLKASGVSLGRGRFCAECLYARCVEWPARVSSCLQGSDH